jgi:hypothetical protein
MRILFDQGTPVPLRRFLTGHRVDTAFERGWHELENGELLAAAESEFDALITTDQNLQHQQNLSQTRLAILVLPITSWPTIEQHVTEIAAAVASLRPGELLKLTFQ